jgi:hypothetical protein
VVDFDFALKAFLLPKTYKPPTSNKYNFYNSIVSFYIQSPSFLSYQPLFLLSITIVLTDFQTRLSGFNLFESLILYITVSFLPSRSRIQNPPEQIAPFFVHSQTAPWSIKILSHAYGNSLLCSFYLFGFWLPATSRTRKREVHPTQVKLVGA